MICTLVKNEVIATSINTDPVCLEYFRMHFQLFGEVYQLITKEYIKDFVLFQKYLDETNIYQHYSPIQLFRNRYTLKEIIELMKKIIEYDDSLCSVSLESESQEKISLCEDCEVTNRSCVDGTRCEDDPRDEWFNAKCQPYTVDDQSGTERSKCYGPCREDNQCYTGLVCDTVHGECRPPDDI
jgi:L-rhamnose mutarotase